MAEADHDDLADALARLASGDVAPSERDHEPPLTPPPAPAAPRSTAKVTFRPATPASTGPTPVALPRQGLRPPTPTVQPTPAPVRPVPTAPASTAAAPPRTARPATPSIRPAAPPPPNLAPPVPAAAGTDDVADVVDDDDAVIMPAPDASVFAPRRKPVTSAQAKARVARRKRIDFRQTVIPVLLTGGVLLVAFGLAPVLVRSDVLLALRGWVTPTLVSLGVVLLALAGLNMVAVRGLLAEAAADSAAV